MIHQRIGSVILFLALASCGGKRAERPAAGADSASMAPVPPAGMKLEAMAMLPVVRAHLDSLARNPSMMRRAGPQSEAKTRRLVNAMHADMARLGMHSDPAYEALADSVVAGSVALSTAGGAELERLVARHVDQLRRLSAVYETKVATMK
ncbi:MAG: hypothetical protein ABI785_11135 [Gemmatimonadales bacterium]